MLTDMKLDVVAMQEVKPTFPSITAATTLAFPERQMYSNQHPSGTVNGVAFLVRKTLDPYVQKSANPDSVLYMDPQATMLGLMFHLPNQKPLRVLNYYGLQTPSAKQWQDSYVRNYPYKVVMGDYNNTIWSQQPRR